MLVISNFLYLHTLKHKLMRLIFIFFTILNTSLLISQTGNLKGFVFSGNQKLSFTTLLLKNNTSKTTITTDQEGLYNFKNISTGKYYITVSTIGYKSLNDTIEILDGKTIIKNFELEADRLNLEQVVISATRNRVNRKKAPVVVNVLSPKLLAATQSIAIADGLSYSPEYV